MSIGGEYRVRRIGRRHWSMLAKSCHLAEATVLSSVASVLQALPAALDEMRLEAPGDTRPGSILTTLLDRIGERVDECTRAMAS